MGNLKNFKKIFVVLLAFSLIAIFSTTETQAAKKTTLSTKSATIGICETTSIDLNNKQSKAKYTYTTNKKSVATVSKKGVVTGKATGTAKITVKQSLKGKNTTVGTFKVTVKKSSLYKGAKDGYGRTIMGQPGYITKENNYTLYPEEYVQYLNPKAKYTYKAETNNAKVTSDGKIIAVTGTGKAKITINETYNKKTRKVGTISFPIAFPEYTGKKTIEFLKGEYFYLPENVDNVADYRFIWYDKEMTDDELAADIEKSSIDTDNAESPDDVIRTVLYSDNSWDGNILAVGEGTRYGYLFAYNYITNKYDSRPFGKMVYVVKEIKDATSLYFTDEILDMEDFYDTNDENIFNMFSGRGYEIPMHQEPFNYTGDIKVTSSDESIVQAVSFSKNTFYNEDEKKGGNIILNALKEGEATITLTSDNGVTCTLKVKVSKARCYSDEDLYFRGYCPTALIPEDAECNDIKVVVKNADGSVCESTAKVEYLSYYDDYTSFEISGSLNAPEGAYTLTVQYKDKTICNYDITLEKYVEDNDSDTDDYYDEGDE